MGTLAGAAVAATIAASRKVVCAFVVGAFFLVGGIANVFMLAAPLRFNAVDLILAYPPMAWLGLPARPRGEGWSATLMAPPVNLYRFRIDLSDVTRGTYDTLDFRLAQHPSESVAFLLTRMLAYALNVQPGLEFSSKGLAEPDEPCLSMPSERGGLALWIEVGNPSARRLHKAAKAAARVVVLTYKNPAPLLKEIRAEGVHNAENLEIFSLEPAFLASLEERLAKDNEWSVLHDEGTLTVSVGDESFACELARHQVKV